MARSYLHIVNPVSFPEAHPLTRAQAITWESMRRAQAFASELSVTLGAVVYEEDRGAVPEGFEVAAPLGRSILDVGAFPTRRKLPLIADILTGGFEVSDADVLIFTNVDIALQPHFYTSVDHLLETTAPCLSITRRTIDDPAEARPPLSALYGQPGRPHPGHDCFVFPRAWVPKLSLGHIAVGVPWIGRAILANLGAMDAGLKVITDAHLTFHLGDDRAWTRPEDRPYRDHNMREARALLTQLLKNPGALTNPHLREATAKWVSARLTGELRYIAGR